MICDGGRVVQGSVSDGIDNVRSSSGRALGWKGRRKREKERYKKVGEEMRIKRGGE